MALRLLRKISATLQCSEFYSIVVDESIDVAKEEQVVIILW